MRSGQIDPRDATAAYLARKLGVASQRQTEISQQAADRARVGSDFAPEVYDYQAPIIIETVSDPGFAIVSPSGTVLAQIDGSTGAATFAGGVNSPIGDIYSQNSATTTTATSNSVYSTNITTGSSITLPTGTWTVIAIANGGYYHATGGSLVDQRVQIDGVNVGSLRNERVGVQADGYTYWDCVVRATGKSGAIEIVNEYKNTSGSGQINAGGGTILWFAFRTA